MDELAVALRDRLRAFVAGRVPAGDVDDVLQDIYLRLASVEAEVESVSGFAHRVARSAIVDHHRARARRREVGVEEVPGEPLVGLEETLDGAAAQVASWLGPLVDALPEPYRATLRATELEGQTHEEVAAGAGIARSTVTSRVKEGRARLRKALTRCCRIELDARGGVVAWSSRAAGGCCDEASRAASAEAGAGLAEPGH